MTILRNGQRAVGIDQWEPDTPWLREISASSTAFPAWDGWDNVRVEVVHLKQHHCFYCGSRVTDGHCPGCGAMDWDRK